tara:strand:+ start:387 stop:728 length:342 start_codon:yes stop_codon:yes gene_type:complete
MIISCKCGIQFEVNKNEIPKEGRNVQCGICNATWFQKPYEKIENNKLEKLPTHYFANFFLLLLLLVSLVGIMETFKEDLLYNFPQLEIYYKFIETYAEKIFDEIRNLLNTFGI